MDHKLKFESPICQTCGRGPDLIPYTEEIVCFTIYTAAVVSLMLLISWLAG